MNSTQLIDRIFAPRRKHIERYSAHAEEIQNKVLKKLISAASDTEWGKKYNFNAINAYSGFQKLPIQTYEDVKDYVDRMRHGEKMYYGMVLLNGMPNLQELQTTRASLFRFRLMV